MRRHGIASWVFAVKDSNHPYLKDTYASTRCHCEFGKRIHFVENPEISIRRLLLENKRDDGIADFRKIHIKNRLGVVIDQGQPEISQAITIMICWHKIISEEKRDITISRKTMAEKVSEIFMSDLLEQEVAVREEYSETELNLFGRIAKK